MCSSSSDEEGGYLGTKKLCNLQTKFNNFYQTKNLDQSDDDDEPLSTRIWSPVKNIISTTVEVAEAKTSPLGTRRTSHRNKEISNNNAILILSDDEAICDPIPSTSSANSYNFITSKIDTSVDIDLIETPDNGITTDDVLQQLDELAETAKELSEDYNAALHGITRGKRKRRMTAKVPAAPVFLSTARGEKRSRAGRKSVRLQHLQHRKSSEQPKHSAIINLDSISDDNSSINNCKKPLKPIVIEKVILNPKVQCNINWRCDSEITHRIDVFKFQCLSSIEDFCCEEYNIDHRLLLFTIDDKPIDLKEHCYASLKLTESAVIDAGVLPESFLHIERPKVAKELRLIRLKVQYVENSKTKDFPVHVKKNDSCAIIFWLIIKELDCVVEKILLKCDGALVKVTDTILSLDLEEDDCLDLTLTKSVKQKLYRKVK